MAQSRWCFKSVHAAKLCHLSQPTSAVDIRCLLQVTDGITTYAVHTGHQMMTLITAAGCSVTALVAAFVSACPEDALFATAAALSIFG